MPTEDVFIPSFTDDRLNGSIATQILIQNTYNRYPCWPNGNESYHIGRVEIEMDLLVWGIDAVEIQAICENLINVRVLGSNYKFFVCNFSKQDNDSFLLNGKLFKGNNSHANI